MPSGSRFPDTEENRGKMREVADVLQGTANSLDGVLQQVFDDEEVTVEDFDTELLRHLDDQVMECTACGWWCETHELDDEQVCDDCSEDDAE